MNPPRPSINTSERLFTVVRRLQQQGIGVVFISHRIHELKAIATP
jgi:simple sugar transport system ATP-binding protein